MIVYWIAAGQMAAYLLALPMYLCLTVACDDGLRWGAGLSAFDARAARRRARANAAIPRRGSSAPARPGARQALSILGHLRHEGILLSGRVSLGDAALTALACGGLNALACALPGPGRGRVRAEFGQDLRFHIELRLQFRLGALLLAMLKRAAKVE